MFKKCMVLMLALFATSAFSCSRVLLQTDVGPFVGRTMDWPLDNMNSKMIKYPRHLQRIGDLNDKRPLGWVSKYGSVVISAYQGFSTDGMNEKGLAVHELWLYATDFGGVRTPWPAISVGMLLQYYLDNFATVDEAVRFTKSHTYQITPLYYAPIKKDIKLHFALEDASGDSAVVEFVGGHAMVYHGKKYNVMTNDPVYPQQLQNLKRYVGLGGNQYLPGGPYATDRFVRASYDATRVAPVKTPLAAVRNLRSVVDNIVHPYIAIKKPDGSVYGSHTIWRTFIDLSRQVYYFGSMNSLNIVSVDLHKLNFNADSKVEVIDLPKHRDYAGDVSGKFVAA